MKVLKVWSPPDTWTGQKGKEMKSYYLDLEGTARRYQVNRYAESPPIEAGKDYDLELSDEQTKSKKFYKARLASKRTVKCPKCGEEFDPFKKSGVPLDTPKGGNASPRGSSGPQNGREDSTQPRLEDLPF